jgi:hypothetical protein
MMSADRSRVRGRPHGRFAFSLSHDLGIAPWGRTDRPAKALPDRTGPGCFNSQAPRLPPRPLESRSGSTLRAEYQDRKLKAVGRSWGVLCARPFNNVDAATGALGGSVDRRRPVKQGGSHCGEPPASVVMNGHDAACAVAGDAPCDTFVPQFGQPAEARSAQIMRRRAGNTEPSARPREGSRQAFRV